MRTEALALACVLSLGGAAWAQEGAAPETNADAGPMSAIDWLSDSLATLRTPTLPSEPDVSTGATVEDVTVQPLGLPMPDAVGLLPVSVTGLPRGLWGASRPDDLALRFRQNQPDMLPAIQALLYTLLLAELDAPAGSEPGSDTVFLARVDRLLSMGALDQAEALLSRAGASSPEIFRRWFDTALLLGTEHELCEVLRATPELSPTFPARIFCLARGGDWNAAVLTLETGRALGFISEEEDALLARFLDPHLFEGEPPLTRPARPTPLTFRMFEAIGEPIPTATLPLAFAQSDLRANIGWKARVEAGERLARTGAVGDNQIWGLYSERRPAASGGVWDRIAALQALDAAIAARNADRVAEVLPDAWAALEQAELEVPFSHIHGKALAGMTLDGDVGALALRMGLLSIDAEEIAQSAAPGSPMDQLLVGLARGQVDGLSAPSPEAQAVIDGFTADTVPVRLAPLLEADRLGEAILRAMALFTSGSRGDLDEVSDALALLRHVGLEATARQAAIEYLVLDRRG